MSLFNLIYINIGPIQKYIYDNIYNTINKCSTVKIFILLNDEYIEEFNTILYKFNIQVDSVTLIPLSIIDQHCAIVNFNKLRFDSSLSSFRNGFWVYTIKRFFYLHAFIDIFKLTNNIHIENDVILTYDLNKIDKTFFNTKFINIVKDTKERCIPSFIYIYDKTIMTDLIDFLLKKLTENSFENDMVLLGSYEKVYLLNNNPDASCDYYVDGASLGQYLNGVDFKNIDAFGVLSLQEQKKVMYTNKYKYFINETSDIDISKYDIVFENLKNTDFNIFNKQKNKSQIVLNLHLHSKQLYFYNQGVIPYQEIITGDRILTLCDYILLHQDSFDFHKIPKDIKTGQVILIKNIQNFILKQSHLTNKNLFWEEIQKNNILKSSPIKICIYTHFLFFFQEYIFPYLSFYPDLNIILYTHNSDDVFDNSFINIINHIQIKHIYAQNLNIINDKCTLLPIGIANNMWKHGDLIQLYETLINNYKFKKISNSVYININPNTFLYRKELLDNILLSKVLKISINKKYQDYLSELASYKYCLCIRGNGIDCHRFYECLYLNVIPILINNSYTNCDGFIKNLKKQNIFFIEIVENNMLNIIHILENLDPDLSCDSINKLPYHRGDCGKIASLSNYQ